MRQWKTDHFLPQKIKPLERSHRLGTRLHISEGNVRLASHLVIPKSHDIKDRAVGREESVKGQSEVIFLHLFGKVGEVETAMI